MKIKLDKAVVEFIPETFKDGYLFGHTGNYLSIKVKGDKGLLNKVVKVKITSIEYPYCMSNLCQSGVDKEKKVIYT